MKTMEQVISQPNDATPMEMALASVDVYAQALRQSVVRGDREAMAMTLDGLSRTAEMIKDWLSRSEH